MKWQILLLSLATIVAFAVGGAKWRARFRASADLEAAERAGKWTLVVPNSPGIELRSRARGVVEVPKPWRDVNSYESIDASPDLHRLTWIDATQYDRPKVVVASSDAPKVPLFTHEVQGARQGAQLSCPTFDADEAAVLWYETDPYGIPSGSYGRPATRLMRKPLAVDGEAREIALPVAAGQEDCFEQSSDGKVFAWVGTDGQIHVANRDPQGSLAHVRGFAGSDFALSRDGTFLAVNEYGRLAKVEIPSGNRAFVGDARIPRVYALSPDDRWVLTQATGAYNSSTAWRLSDGAPVPMGTVGMNFLGARRHLWIAWTGDVLPEPAATPKTKPARTPRRNPSPTP